MKRLIRRAAGALSMARMAPNSRRDSLVFPLRLEQSIEDRLHQIPSQTSSAERRMLYQFFSQLWTGQNDVVEIGPFLGGTSRAIALGMLHNPRRSTGKLYTFDRFRDYFELARLSEYLQPLVDSDELKQSDLAGLGERAPFIEIFKRIHQSHDYYNCVEPSDNGVPDLPEQVDGGEWMQLPEGFQTDAIFVDGCKSWFGTKYFMKLVAPVARPGATFLFQDFGWFTCFWLPAFIECFSDVFSLMGSVDNTYLFSTTRSLSVSEIEERFPDYPEEVGVDQLNQWFESQVNQAAKRFDSFAEIRHIMHHAAAMAYVDEKAQARELLRRAENHPQAPSHKQVLEKAWRSPTYTPTAEVKLGK